MKKHPHSTFRIPPSAFLVLAFLSVPASAQLGRKARALDLNQAGSILEDARVQAIYDNYLAAWAPLDPEGATDIGLHDYDHVLTLEDDASARARRGVFEKFAARLHDETSVERLDRMGELRFRAMLAEFQARAWLAAHHDLRKTDPLLYLRTRAVLDLPPASYGAVLDRARNALSRLEMLPAVLQQARANLYHPPRLWVLAAIRDCDAAAKSLDALPALMQVTFEMSPENPGRIAGDTQDAKAALSAYKVYLTTAVLPTADGKFALGEEGYDWLLHNQHLMTLSNYRALRLAEKGVKAAAKQMKKLARDIDRKKSWQDQYRELTAAAPVAPAALLEQYKRELGLVRQHVEREGLFTMPAEGLTVEETPPDLRSRMPRSGYRGFPPLDLSNQGHFYVTISSGQSAPSLEGQVALGAYPGAHMLAARAKHAATQFQRAASAPLMTGGWPLYAQQLADESGFYASAASRLINARTPLAAAAEAVVDARLHCGDWTAEQAMQYLEKEALATPEDAEAAVLDITQNPTKAMAAFFGAQELARIRKRMERRLGDQFTLREFHDRLFSYGAVPPSLIERHLYKDWVRK